jgi:hypothetical protein
MNDKVVIEITKKNLSFIRSHVIIFVGQIIIYLNTHNFLFLKHDICIKATTFFSQIRKVDGREVISATNYNSFPFSMNQSLSLGEGKHVVRWEI